MQRTAIDRHKGDGKCADFAIAGSKDQIRLRLRNATEWNGQSKERDFRNLAKAAAAIEDALIH